MVGKETNQMGSSIFVERFIGLNTSEESSSSEDGSGSTPKLSPSFDVKIWKYEIKTQLADLQTQLEKANAIIKVLEKLQKDCARTADNLNNTLLSLKEQLKKKIEAGKVKVADLQKQAAAAKCNFW